MLGGFLLCFCIRNTHRVLFGGFLVTHNLVGLQHQDWRRRWDCYMKPSTQKGEKKYLSLPHPPQITPRETSKQIILMLFCEQGRYKNSKQLKLQVRASRKIFLLVTANLCHQGQHKELLHWKSFAGLPFKALVSLQKEELFLSCACNCCPLVQQQNLLQFNSYSV